MGSNINCTTFLFNFVYFSFLFFNFFRRINFYLLAAVADFFPSYTVCIINHQFLFKTGAQHLVPLHRFNQNSNGCRWWPGISYRYTDDYTKHPCMSLPRNKVSFTHCANPVTEYPTSSVALAKSFTLFILATDLSLSFSFLSIFFFFQNNPKPIQ